MGNNLVGLAMGRAARVYWGTRGQQLLPTQVEALAVLDEICSPYKGADAEFEADDPKNPDRINPDYDRFTDPEGPLGKLIAIAFEATPEEMELETEAWDNGPKTRFDKRYRFC